MKKNINSLPPDNSYKLSVMLWPFLPNLPFIERIKQIVAAGIHSVQLTREYENWSEDDFLFYRQKLNELGVSIDSITCDMVKSGTPKISCLDITQRAIFLKDIQQKIKIMEKLDCSNLIIVAGDSIANYSKDEQYVTCLENLKLVLKIIEPLGFNLLIEHINCEQNPDSFFWSVPETVKMIEEIDNPQIKLLFDVYHAQLSGGNLINNLERYIKYIGLIHLADVPGRHQPGTGEINFQNLYKKISELNYSGYIAMEFMPTTDHIEALQKVQQDLLNHTQ